MTDAKMETLNARLKSLNEDLQKEQEALSQIQSVQQKVENELKVRHNNVLIIAAKVQECKDTIAIFEKKDEA